MFSFLFQEAGLIITIDGAGGTASIKNQNIIIIIIHGEAHEEGLPISISFYHGSSLIMRKATPNPHTDPIPSLLGMEMVPLFQAGA